MLCPVAEAAPGAHALRLFGAATLARAVWVALVAAEMDEEEEEEATTGVRGAVHSDDWKYSCVGIDSAPVSDEKCVWWHKMHECKWKSLWCVGIGLVEEDHVGVGDELCSRDVSTAHSTYRPGKTSTALIPCFTGRPTSILKTHCER
jgi:hypothetical protein